MARLGPAFRAERPGRALVLPVLAFVGRLDVSSGWCCRPSRTWRTPAASRAFCFAVAPELAPYVLVVPGVVDD
jgi:hypothetical protein